MVAGHWGRGRAETLTAERLAKGQGRAARETTGSADAHGGHRAARLRGDRLRNTVENARKPKKRVPPRARPAPAGKGEWSSGLGWSGRDRERAR